MIDERANAMAAEFVRGKIRAIVRDPETALRAKPPIRQRSSNRASHSSGLTASADAIFGGNSLPKPTRMRRLRARESLDSRT